MLKGGFITCLEKIEPANLLGVKLQETVKGKFDQTFVAVLNLLFTQLDNPNATNNLCVEDKGENLSLGAHLCNSVQISEKQEQFRTEFLSKLEEKKELLSTLLEDLEAILQEPTILKDSKALLSILRHLKEKLANCSHPEQIKALVVALVNVCSHQISDNPESNPSENTTLSLEKLSSATESPRGVSDKRLESIIQRLQEILGEKPEVQDKNTKSETCSKDISKELNPKGNLEITQKGLINRNENTDLELAQRILNSKELSKNNPTETGLPNRNENTNSEFVQRILNSKELSQNGKGTKLASPLPQIQETQEKSLETILVKTQFNPHETKGEIEVKVSLPPKEEVKTNIETKSETDKTVIASTQPKIDIHVSQLERTDSPQGPHYLDKSNVLDQIAKGVHIQLKAGKKEATIQLEPPSLGKLHIKVDIENGVVKVHFIAAYQTAKELIEANLVSLRQTLLQQGVQVGEFSVALGGQQSASSGNREGKNNSEQREPGEKEITPIKAVEEKKPFSSTGEIDFWV